MDIKVAESPSEMAECFAILNYLRPQLEREDFVQKVQRQYQQGYRIAYIKNNQMVVSLIGYRFLECMAWGRILYIDDLVTHPTAKRRGYAGQLLDWACDKAIKASCDEVHLDTGPLRHDAHRLYLNKGFQINSHHLAKRFRP